MSENLVTIPSDEKSSAGPDEEHTEDSNQNNLSSADAKGTEPARLHEEIIIAVKVELIITEDDIHNIKADDIVCIWSKKMLNVGPIHPLLRGSRVKLENWSEFKEEIRSGQIIKTFSGLEGIGQMVHYKTAWNVKEIIEKMFHVCKDSSVVVIPFCYSEALYSNTKATVQALLRLVRNIERCQRECSIRKIIVSCGSKETKDHLDELISRIKIKRTESKERHENCFALIIAGYNSRKEVAEIYINDAITMKETLQDPDIVGIREENITMIKTSEPAVIDYFMCERVVKAFSELPQQIREKEHPFFLLYFSGHYDQSSLCLGGLLSRMTPKQIEKQLQSLDAETVMIILDCSFSGGVDLTKFNEEDFTKSLQSIESKDNENYVLLPELWNFYKERDVVDAKKNTIRVKQWSSSFPDKRSFFIRELDLSLFTECIIDLLEGRCPVAAEDCKICQKYHQTAAEEEFVFLYNLHDCVGLHMGKLAEKFNLRQQQLVLVGNDADDMVIPFYLSQT